MIYCELKYDHLEILDMRTELIRVDWDHILYDYGKDRLLLTVSCGRSDVFSVSLLLIPTELKRYCA